MDEREQLIQELTAARRELFAVIDQFGEQMEIYPLWTIKELLAHLTGWDDAVLATLRSVIMDLPPETPAVRGINHYNARTVSEREALDLDHIRKECMRTRQEVFTALRLVPLEKMHEEIVYPWGGGGTIAQMIRVFVHHEGEEHAQELRGLYLGLLSS
jgi:hypothetical protein